MNSEEFISRKGYDSEKLKEVFEYKDLASNSIFNSQMSTSVNDNAINYFQKEMNRILELTPELNQLDKNILAYTKLFIDLNDSDFDPLSKEFKDAISEFMANDGISSSNILMLRDLNSNLNLVFNQYYPEISNDSFTKQFFTAVDNYLEPVGEYINDISLQLASEEQNIYLDTYKNIQALAFDFKENYNVRADKNETKIVPKEDLANLRNTYSERLKDTFMKAYLQHATQNKEDTILSLADFSEILMQNFNNYTNILKGSDLEEENSYILLTEYMDKGRSLKHPRQAELVFMDLQDMLIGRANTVNSETNLVMNGLLRQSSLVELFNNLIEKIFDSGEHQLEKRTNDYSEFYNKNIRPQLNYLLAEEVHTKFQVIFIVLD